MSAAKRRAKAVARRGWVTDLRERWDYITGRIPSDAVSVMACSCGRRMWLREGATSEQQESFDQDVAAHDYCDSEVYA